jgi:hypothetical protein
MTRPRSPGSAGGEASGLVGEYAVPILPSRDLEETLRFYASASNRVERRLLAGF